MQGDLNRLDDLLQNVGQHSLVDAAPCLHCGLHIAQTGLREYEVSDCLGHVGRAANFGLLESRSVVHAISGHADHLPTALKCLDQAELVFGKDTSEDGTIKMLGDVLLMQSLGWTGTAFNTHLRSNCFAPRVTQAAARHGDIALTMQRYSDPQLLDIAGALEVLPELPLGISHSARPESMQATGTDDASGAGARTVAPEADRNRPSLSFLDHQAAQPHLAMWKRSTRA